MGSKHTKVKFSLVRGDSQISFKGVIPEGDLVYRQYCLLSAPKHLLKIYVFVKADKSTNFYEVDSPEYNRLINDNVTKTYRKADIKLSK